MVKIIIFEEKKEGGEGVIITSRSARRSSTDEGGSTSLLPASRSCSSNSLSAPAIGFGGAVSESLFFLI